MGKRDRRVISDTNLGDRRFIVQPCRCRDASG